MAKKKLPVDPMESPQYGLQGTIVTMHAPDDIVQGTIYINAGRVEAIVPNGKAVPEPLADYPVYNTKGTIFPGFIELHNHLSYNCLPMWDVPKRYENRDQWSGIPAYQQLISFPMNILGKTPGYVEAIVRYVECKCLAGGVTTSQGIMLFSNAGIKKYYRGIVRNVESTDDDSLPIVDAHIPNLAASDIEKFSQQLQKSSCLLLHLCEGTNASARKRFTDLQYGNKEWAIGPSLSGIHCVALQAEDYAIMSQKGASMIWSPFSNLLLYGQTADMKSAKASGIKIGLGSDWAPSGSKNLLGELKVAKLYNEANGNLFTDYELVAMATRNAAEIIKWDKELGTLQPGKRADLLVVGAQNNSNPFKVLFTASEKTIDLVVVNGVPRFGSAALMRQFKLAGEEKTIGRKLKYFNLAQASGNEVVGKLKLSQAETTLTKGLKNLKKLAEGGGPLTTITDTKGHRVMAPATTKARAAAAPQWVLVLDHNEEEGEALRTHFEEGSRAGAADKKMIAQAVDPDVLVPIELDALTVATDKNFFKKVAAQRNLPAYVKTGLKPLYGDL